MADFEIIEQLYQGHYCSNCSKQAFCKKNPEHSTCIEWEKLDPMVSVMLKVVRLTYPNTVRGEIFKEFAMEKSSNDIYLKSVFTKKEEENETT